MGHHRSVRMVCLWLWAGLLSGFQGFQGFPGLPQSQHRTGWERAWPSADSGSCSGTIFNGRGREARKSHPRSSALWGASTTSPTVDPSKQISSAPTPPTPHTPTPTPPTPTPTPTPPSDMLAAKRINKLIVETLRPETLKPADLQRLACHLEMHSASLNQVNAITLLHRCAKRGLQVSDFCNLEVIIELLHPRHGVASAQGLANALYGLQRMSDTSSVERRLIAALAEQLLRSRGRFDGQAVSNAFYGLKHFTWACEESVALLYALQFTLVQNYVLTNTNPGTYTSPPKNTSTSNGTNNSTSTSTSSYSNASSASGSNSGGLRSPGSGAGGPAGGSEDGERRALSMVATEARALLEQARERERETERQGGEWGLSGQEGKQEGQGKQGGERGDGGGRGGSARTRPFRTPVAALLRVDRAADFAVPMTAQGVAGVMMGLQGMRTRDVRTYIELDIEPSQPTLQGGPSAPSAAQRSKAYLKRFLLSFVAGCLAPPTSPTPVSAEPPQMDQMQLDSQAFANVLLGLKHCSAR
ncbi:hypothetical protein B484DRAFT_205578 [Ochromonadaceae sp. CCMP2298]|nr:hypothetical protein B484DRAFT_205578 [Ochromonadaceae sp. CCMP2298]